MDLRSSRPFRVTYSVCFITAVILLLPLSAQQTLTIDMLAATRALWPREVTVNIAHQVPLLVNGKVSGSMQAAPDRVYPVRSIEPDGVVVDAMGSSLTFPPADTDILPRAETVRTRLGTLAAASQDNSKEEMLEYMKHDGMPWPALKFANASSSPLEKYSGRGIPCLVVIDQQGKVLSHSYKGEKYLGPSKVIKDLEGLLATE
jgi:hypothetical protein